MPQISPPAGLRSRPVPAPEPQGQPRPGAGCWPRHSHEPGAPQTGDQVGHQGDRGTRHPPERTPQIQAEADEAVQEQAAQEGGAGVSGAGQRDPMRGHGWGSQRGTGQGGTKPRFPCRFGDDIPGMEGLGTGTGSRSQIYWGSKVPYGDSHCCQGGFCADAASFLPRYHRDLPLGSLQPPGAARAGSVRHHLGRPRPPQPIHPIALLV